jgi:hypothetical protein
MTNFELIVKCINNKKIGDTVSRQELMDCTTCHNGFHVSSTVDIYRRKLTLFGFLSNYSRGVYKKEQDIPTHLRSSHVTKISNTSIARLVKIRKITNQIKN